MSTIVDHRCAGWLLRTNSPSERPILLTSASVNVPVLKPAPMVSLAQNVNNFQTACVKARVWAPPPPSPPTSLPSLVPPLPPPPTPVQVGSSHGARNIALFSCSKLCSDCCEVLELCWRRNILATATCQS